MLKRRPTIAPWLVSCRNDVSPKSRGTTTPQQDTNRISSLRALPGYVVLPVSDTERETPPRRDTGSLADSPRTQELNKRRLSSKLSKRLLSNEVNLQQQQAQVNECLTAHSSRTIPSQISTAMIPLVIQIRSSSDVPPPRQGMRRAETSPRRWETGSFTLLDRTPVLPKRGAAKALAYYSEARTI